MVLIFVWFSSSLSDKNFFALSINSVAISSSKPSIDNNSDLSVSITSSTLPNPSLTSSCASVSSTSKDETNMSVLFIKSSCRLDDSSSSVNISISYPVNSVASLTFWPLHPIARLKCSSDTTTSNLFWSSYRTTFKTSAGESEANAKFAESLFKVHYRTCIAHPVEIMWKLNNWGVV